MLEANLPGVRRFQAGDDVQQRGLADAGFSDDGDVLGGLDAQRDRAQDPPLAEAFFDTGDIKHAACILDTL
jgi:hypothetical protein